MKTGKAYHIHTTPLPSGEVELRINGLQIGKYSSNWRAIRDAAATIDQDETLAEFLPREGEP